MRRPGPSLPLIGGAGHRLHVGVAVLAFRGHSNLDGHKLRLHRLCWLSRLNKAPLGVTKDGAPAEQSVWASAGAFVKDSSSNQAITRATCMAVALSSCLIYTPFL